MGGTVETLLEKGLGQNCGSTDNHNSVNERARSSPTAFAASVLPELQAGWVSMPLALAPLQMRGQKGSPVPSPRPSHLPGLLIRAAATKERFEGQGESLGMQMYVCVCVHVGVHVRVQMGMCISFY